MLMEVLVVGTWFLVWDANRPLYVAFLVIAMFCQDLGIFIGKWGTFEDVRTSKCTVRTLRFPDAHAVAMHR